MADEDELIELANQTAKAQRKKKKTKTKKRKDIRFSSHKQQRRERKKVALNLANAAVATSCSDGSAPSVTVDNLVMDSEAAQHLDRAGPVPDYEQEVTITWALGQELGLALKISNHQVMEDLMAVISGDSTGKQVARHMVRQLPQLSNQGGLEMLISEPKKIGDVHDLSIANQAFRLANNHSD